MRKQYKVIAYFTDAQDGEHIYKVGDEYPRQGIEVSDERIEELSSSKNAKGRPMIEEVRSRRRNEDENDRS